MRFAKRNIASSRKWRPRTQTTRKTNSFTTCGGGQNGCAVDPTGKMTICVLSHRDGYDLRSGSFQLGWNGRLGEIRKSERTSKTICTDCRLQSLCSMCPAMGELENGNAESPVEFICQVAHLRAYTLGLEVRAHGDCPCCSGGVHHAHLKDSAERLREDSGTLQKYSSADSTDGDTAGVAVSQGLRIRREMPPPAGTGIR